MSSPAPLARPWMIAAWPGMGNVALIAASYLIQEVGMTQGDGLPPGDHFEVSEIAAKRREETGSAATGA